MDSGIGGHEAKVKVKMKMKRARAEDDHDEVPTLKRKLKKKRKQKQDADNGAGQEATTAARDDENGSQTIDEREVNTAKSLPAVKYVPPHLRNLGDGDDERKRLERRIRGQLNRLSETNLESIAGELSDMIQTDGRRTVTEIISTEVVNVFCDGPRGNAQHAAVFAAFVAGMAALVGIDFGAKVVAALAVSFEDEYGRENSLGTRNLALLISHLFIFRLLPSDVVYELLAVLCKRFQELDVATVLAILQSCGMALRGQDPVAMKDFVLSIQQRAAEAKSSMFQKEGSSTELSKRVQFMLDTICDIKNNKKIAKEPPSHVPVKKWLQKIGVDEVQLRGVTWKGLLDPEKKGQWWLSSAMNADNRDFLGEGEEAGNMDAGVVEVDKMLRLAASQRINTDSRRAVFCMVMGAEDYVDAFEKLLRLKLPGQQDREILRVIVECCLQEKLFNKYYVLLSAKLCGHDKNHRVTLTFCVWDHFKQLSKMELRRSANLARFLAHMIGSYALSVSVLKAVEFTDPHVMTAKVVMHFRILLDELFKEYPEQVIWNCFSRVAANEELVVLRDGLAAFLHLQEKQSSGGNQGASEHHKMFTDRCRLARKALSNAAGVTLD